MGMQGAALATLIFWAVAFVLMILTLWRHSLIQFSSLINFTETLALMHEIFRIGGASAMTQLLNPIAIAVLTRLVAGFGESAVAAFGIDVRIELVHLCF